MEVDKIICDDCLSILKVFPDVCFDLIVVDPPYNVGIEEWDKIKNYYDWLLERLICFERVLKDNGTMWLFHTSFPTLSKIHQRLERETNFRFKQFITINKGLQSIAGRSSENLRSYPRATEYIILYTFEDRTGAEQLNEKHHRINPMSKYLKEEFQRAGVTKQEIATLFPSKTGGMTGCVRNWILGYNFPLKWQYEKMRGYLKGEYLNQEYEDLRYTFNLELGVTDVWDIDFYKDRVSWHPTSKPLKLIERIIKTATTEGDIVLDPFLGSGTTALVCKSLNRRYIGIEINPEYVELAKKRKINYSLLGR